MNNNSLAKRVKQLERLLEIGRNLSATLELEPLLQSISETASDLTCSQHASILLYDNSTEQLEFVAAPWLGEDTTRSTKVPLENSISGEVIKRCKTITLQDLSKQQHCFTDIFETGQSKPANVLAVPLKIGDEVTGVLLTLNKQEGEGYTRGDADILEKLASQAAIAIHNASLMQELQQANDEISRLDQMKREFIAITSHELRTPVGLILGHATFMREMVPDELHEQVDVIIESSTHMRDILNDLYKANVFQSGMERLRQRDFNLNQLVDEVVQANQRLAREKDIQLKADLPQTEVVYKGDNEKIGIALSHLVRNAIVFNDPGGKASISLSRSDEEVRIAVKDNGIGIPPEDQQRIFERFYQVEDHLTREHGGMGLGLSVARMMVEMHRGRLELESTAGKGSTFSIHLPLQPGE